MFLGVNIKPQSQASNHSWGERIEMENIKRDEKFQMQGLKIDATLPIIKIGP